MKKFLLVLSVVAMASLLFVGCIPTVPVAVTGVTLDQETLVLVAGGATGTLVETVEPANATDPSVTWASSDEAVATVADGVVTPLTAGTTTITVTTVDGSLTATSAVTVDPAAAVVVVVAVTGVTLDEATLALTVGGATGTLVETVEPADATDPSVTWASSDEAVATVADGVVTPLTAGTTIITVTTVDGSLTATCLVTVDPAAVTDAAAVTAVNAATTSAALNAALANDVFTGYLVANYTAYYTAIATFSTTLTGTVTLVNAAIVAVNTVVTDAAAVIAVNVATTSAALNAALANDVFTDYLVANYDEYYAAIATFSTTLTGTVTLVNAAIVVVNTAATEAAADAAAVAAVNVATTSLALNAALANDVFTDYLAANSAAYYAAIADFSTTLTGTVTLVNAAIVAVNTAETAAAETAAIAAVNVATTSAALNAALANDVFTGYAAVNYTAYYTNIAKFSTALTPTVVKINAAIVVVNIAEAGKAVGDYTDITDATDLDTDKEIADAVADDSGKRAKAVATVAALKEGTVKTTHLATITANDLTITTAATITAVTAEGATIQEVINSFTTVTARARNAVDVELITDVTYVWSVKVASDGGSTAVHTAALTDLVFSSETRVTVITLALAVDEGDSYTIKVVATKDGIEKEDTALVVVE